MDESRRDDTRKLLRIFGVAVTNFEERSGEVLERLRRHEGPPDRDLLDAVRQLLSAVVETNQKWQQVTDHLFGAQRDALAEAMKELAGIERR